MTIGDIKLGDTSRAQSQARVNPNAFGAGIARAISGLAGATGDFARSKELLTKATAGRHDALENADVASRFIHYQGEQGRVQARRLQATEGPAVGVTNLTHDEITKGNDSWLASIPERLRKTYIPKLATLAESQITGAFNYEYQQGNAFFGQLTSDTMNELATQMQNDDIGADEALESIVELLSQSDIPDLEQQAFLSAANTMFMSVEFSKEIGIGLAGGGAVNDGTTGDIAMAGAQPAQRGILNAIASPESGGDYTARYSKAGGATFDDFAGHPRIYEEVPRDLNHYTSQELLELAAGNMRPKKSSAAGRYQFTASTWDMAAEALGLTDFSPESQDRAALWNAARVYNQGLEFGDLTFDQMINSGNRDMIIEVKNALAENEWIGLRGMSDDEFANILLGAQGIEGGGTGNAVSPDLWNDSRYDGLSYADKLGLAQDAATAMAAQQTAQDKFLKDQLTAMRNDAYLGALQGDYTSNDRQGLINAGVLTTADELIKYDKHVADFKNRVQSNADMQTRFDSGGIFTQGGDNDSANAYFGAQGAQSLGEKDKAYAANHFRPTVDRLGFIPSDSAAVLTSMANGSDPTSRAYAMGVLADIHQGNSRILNGSEGISRDLADNVAAFEILRRFTPIGGGEEAIAFLDTMTDPNNATLIKEQTKIATELFGELSEFDVLNAFKPSALVRAFPGRVTPLLPQTTAAAAIFNEDAQALFTKGFILTGTAEGAQEFMDAQLPMRWGASDIGGLNQLMQHPPQNFVETVSNDYTWIDNQIRSELNFDSGEVFTLVPDDRTLLDGTTFGQTGEGDNASYLVVRKNDRGEWEQVKGEDGEPYRYMPEITEDIRGGAAALGAHANLLEERAVAIERLNTTELNAELHTDMERAEARAAVLTIENTLYGRQYENPEAFSMGTPEYRTATQRDALEFSEEQLQMTWDSVYSPDAPKAMAWLGRLRGREDFDNLVKAVREAGGTLPEGLE